MTCAESLRGVSCRTW